MKNILMLFLIFSLFGNAFAQKNYSRRIQLNISIPDEQDGKKYYLSTIEKYKLDSAVVSKGKLIFSYEGEPDALIIERSNDRKKLAAFWSDLYDIKLTASIENSDALKVEGSPIAEKLKILMPGLNDLMQQRNEFNFQGKNHLADSISGLIHKKYLAEIEDNKNTYYSMLILYYAVAGKFISNQTATALIQQFDIDLKSTKLGARLTSLILPANDIAINSTAPTFSQADKKGKVVYLSDFKGKYVLLEFWASWCAPCITVNANLLPLYLKRGERPFEIVGISLDSNKDEWLQSIRTQGLIWPQLSDLKGERNEVGQLYKVTGLPRNFLIDPTGKIVAINISIDSLAEVLNALGK